MNNTGMRALARLPPVISQVLFQMVGLIYSFMKANIYRASATWQPWRHMQGRWGSAHKSHVLPLLEREPHESQIRSMYVWKLVLECDELHWNSTGWHDGVSRGGGRQGSAVDRLCGEPCWRSWLSWEPQEKKLVCLGMKALRGRRWWSVWGLLPKRMQSTKVLINYQVCWLAFWHPDTS